MTQTIVCDSFNAKIREEFPGCFVNARVQRMIGGDTIVITFANVPRLEDAPNGIAENANAFMRLLVHREPPGATIERPTMHYNDKALKFRKISAKTEAEAMTKLADWFIRNKAVILASKPSWRK